MKEDDDLKKILGVTAMQIHEMIPESRVNGPGRRAVVWFQGCTLACPGCWNPETHRFGVRPERSVEEVGNWILSCADINGVTMSGGEPFQQAAELLQLCEYLKARKPGLSIGLFSGYTSLELAQERWHYRSPGNNGWRQGTNALFNMIVNYLDFGVFGRYSRAQASADKPLCGSRNQQVIFFNDRYSERDLEPQSCEINISLDGNDMTVTGFPPPDLLQSLSAK